MNFIKDLAKVWNKSLTLTVTSFLVMTGLAIGSVIAVPAANAETVNPGCSFVAHNGDKNGNAALTVHGNSIEGTFNVPQGCKPFEVSLVVYSVANGDWKVQVGNQHIFSVTSTMAKVGGNSLTAKLPDCTWQADLVMGLPAKLAQGQTQGTADMIVAKVGNKGVACTVPKTVTTTTTTTSTPATPAATVLPNTGPGSIVAIFASAAAVGTAIYRVAILRRFGTR